MSWMQTYKGKTVSPSTAADAVRSGDNVYIGVFNPYPAAVVKALIARRDELTDVQLFDVPVRRRYDRLFRDVIAAGIDAGEFRVISIDASLHCLWGALNHIPVWYRDPTDASLETIIDEISDTVLMLFGVE